MIILLITGIPCIFGLLLIMCLKCGCLDYLTYDWKILTNSWRFRQSFAQTEREMAAADYIKRKRYVRYQQILEEQDNSTEDEDFDEVGVREFIYKQKEKRKLNLKKCLRMARKYKIELQC